MRALITTRCIWCNAPYLTVDPDAYDSCPRCSHLQLAERRAVAWHDDPPAD